jgi:hypothetical protein
MEIHVAEFLILNGWIKTYQGNYIYLLPPNREKYFAGYSMALPGPWILYEGKGVFHQMIRNTQPYLKNAKQAFKNLLLLHIRIPYILPKGILPNIAKYLAHLI